MPAISKLVKYIKGGDGYYQNCITVLDPCAGTGDAVRALYGSFGVGGYSKLLTCELEDTRAKELRYQCYGNSFHGDAFNLRWDMGGKRGVQILFLNPPYDYDPQFKRLEEKFLHRFKDAIGPGGVLLFVVPHYALAASAATIAEHFDSVECFRFPDGDFEVFKQVVLVARKINNPLGFISPLIQGQIEAWAEDVSDIPILSEDLAPVLTLPELDSSGTGFASFTLAQLDLVALKAKLRPWAYSDKSGRLQDIRGIFPTDDVLVRQYPLAMPPKPGHIAAGIASGVFNGNRITPDDPKSGKPSLLVKGVFDKEFQTIEEKKNKDGETSGYIQVQQPKLVITALDLSTNKIHTLKASGELTNTNVVADMTAADLLQGYGRSLMSVMLQQCPVLHDPNRADHQIELGKVARPLFHAQAQAAMAATKLLGGVGVPMRSRRGKTAYVLGEIGSGKSSVALSVASTIGAKRVLVMCPPHLLDSWKEQASIVLPWAKTCVLNTVEDVDNLRDDTSEGVTIAILSRETAKLSHAWEGVHSCPKCGAQPAFSPSELARVRARCESTRLIPKDVVGKASKELALLLMPFAPDTYAAQALFNRPFHSKLLKAYSDKSKPSWSSSRGSMVTILGKVFEPLLKKGADIFGFTISLLTLAINDEDVTERVIRLVWDMNRSGESWQGYGYRSLAFTLLHFLSPERRDVIAQELESLPTAPSSGLYNSPVVEWTDWKNRCETIAEGGSHEFRQGFAMVDGKLTFAKHFPGTVALAKEALSSLTNLGVFARTAPCGEFLYQAVPAPRRVPLANYIAHRTKKLFDLLIQDEIHEYQAQTSAQGFAARQLTGLGIPTLGLTGSVMGGYAASLFANQWALDAQFREEFGRDEIAEFVKRYGYLKQLVEEKDKDSGKVVAYGSQSDRVETSVRNIGNAPGVLPIFLLRYLLRISVVLHKSDLSVDVPPRKDFADRVDMLPEQSEQFNILKSALMDNIRKDQFTELAGKLWGQMAELPSYLDRATNDVGNTDEGIYEIRYPENCGGDFVAKAEPIRAVLLPKEEWMLDRLKQELDEGRNVMILGWHTKLLPRLSRLIESRLGVEAPVLDPNKVAAAKRQAWIDKEVLKKGRRVLIVNPVAVQTGLNNLVHFSTQIWMENPAVNAVVFRQATGRIDRIGQKKETRIYFPVYRGVSQESMHKLLLHKVGVSMAVDGLDAESALHAAGVGDSSEFSALSVGKQLFEMFQQAA